MFQRIFAVAMLISLTLSGATSAVSGVGGPPQELRLEENGSGKKDALLRAHFAELDGEEERVAREAKALRRALVLASKKSDRVHRAALERRIKELTIINTQIAEARSVLISLQRDERTYAMLLADSYGEKDKRDDRVLSSPNSGDSRISTAFYDTYETGSAELSWPVNPFKGLSAGFRDSGYLKRFGFEHNAIDIPEPQGTVITAPADATVIATNDRGFGYNTLVLQHADGIETLYGHVTDFLVEEGDTIQRGDAIALSGGRPGSKGAGLLTTGPHVHFEVRVHGQGVDPLYYLSPMVVAMGEI